MLGVLYAVALLRCIYSTVVRYTVNAGFKVICSTCLHFNFEHSKTVPFAHG